MANILLKEEVIKLRKRGKSIRDISKTLGASKSSVSYWCRDISLTNKQIDTLEQGQKRSSIRALLKASEIKREQRKIDTKKYFNLGKNDVGKISERDLFMVGVALYWAEGYKKGSEELGFTNSDKDMVKFFIKWLNQIYGIKKEDLILRVSINNIHEERINKVLKYWSNIARVPISQFTKTSIIKTKSKKVYKNKEEHFGTLRIKVRRGTNLRRRVLGSIDALKNFSF